MVTVYYVPACIYCLIVYNRVKIISLYNTVNEHSCEFGPI